jgi:hypothetical protein
MKKYYNDSTIASKPKLSLPMGQLPFMEKREPFPKLEGELTQGQGATCERERLPPLKRTPSKCHNSSEGR